MPRAKRKKVEPLDRLTVKLEGELVEVEFWDSPADEGTRGAHTRAVRAKVIDAVLETTEHWLNGTYPTQKEKFERLIDGRISLAEFGRQVVAIAKGRKIKIRQTLSEEVAQSIRNHYKAIENAQAKIKAVKKISPTNPDATSKGTSRRERLMTGTSRRGNLPF